MFPASVIPAPASLGDIRLPEDFRIEYFTRDVPGARSLARGPDGIVFVGTRSEGKVYAVVDRNGDGKVDEVIVIAKGLDSPNGVAYRDGSLYVAEIGRVIRFDDIARRLKHPPKPVVVNDSFPKEGDHGWKFIRFGPDGRLYVPVGAPCNICERRDDPRFASITRMNPDGSQLEIFARGVRNTVGFDWSPATRELWFTDNGRDLLGDDRPPDELNRAPVKGLHFGYPYRHGKDIVDPDFGTKAPSGLSFTAPELELGPHVASLGMRFYNGTMFPEAYRGGIFIAEHGSWNRSTPIGYRVTFVPLKGGKAAAYTVFAEGWLKGKAAWGRPVDLEVLADGSLLVSDDKQGAIYRITYGGRKK
ncbi:PQQ-dependent sugar dehydrogenase [Geobacter sp. SVR]|uniref:PQQ-dependent sugar dehydrogenase n=1 Tax=Geobacter sp. SVR TaxID=2495594 RepID=UPI0015666B4E